MILLFLTLFSAHANMVGKTVHLLGGVAVGDCAPNSTEAAYGCSTPHSREKLDLTFTDDEGGPHAGWTQTYQIGPNRVEAAFDIFENPDGFDISVAINVSGAETRVTSATVTLKSLDQFMKINTSSPPLPTPKNMRIVDLTVTKP